MIRIGICDDDADVMASIGECVKLQFDEYNEAVEIVNFDDSQDLIGKLTANEYFDLLFLDIQMPVKSGIDVAVHLRENCRNDLTQIVFISSESGYAMKLFEVRPMDFLLKPVSEKQIEKIVKLAMRLITNNRSVFQFRMQNQLVKIRMADIEYFESSSRRIKLVAVDGEYIFYDRLESVYEQVKDYNFMYIHKSYVVNSTHVKQFTSRYLVMYNGMQIPVSRNKRGEIKTLWQ